MIYNQYQELFLITRRFQVLLGSIPHNHKLSVFLNRLVQIPMMKHSFLLATVLIALVCFVPSYAQTNNEKIFAAVPIAQRARFIERLNLYIEYSLNRQQDKLLELYDEETVCSLCKGKSKCTEECAPPMVAEVLEGYNSVLVNLSQQK